MDVRLRRMSEGSEGDSREGFGNGENSGLSRKFDPNDPCSYSTIRKYKCHLEGNDVAGNAVQKCERTEQLLRRCPGRPVEIVKSETEYTEGDAANGIPNFSFEGSDRSLSPPGLHSDVDQDSRSILPRPLQESDWPRNFTQRDERQHSSAVPGGFAGFGGIINAIEDVVRETEDMAHSFLNVFGLNGDETDRTSNPFDRWFGHDAVGGSERRAPRASEPDGGNRPAQSSKPDIHEARDFREV